MSEERGVAELKAPRSSGISRTTSDARLANNKLFTFIGPTTRASTLASTSSNRQA
jgi:hypothetical protein